MNWVGIEIYHNNMSGDGFPDIYEYCLKYLKYTDITFITEEEMELKYHYLHQFSPSYYYLLSKKSNTDIISNSIEYLNLDDDNIYLNELFDDSKNIPYDISMLVRNIIREHKLKYIENL